LLGIIALGVNADGKEVKKQQDKWDKDQ